VSAVGRDHLSSSLTLSMDQHDAAVNPGNSGGPLFNLWGSVVGLNVGIRTESGGFEGISLTVPARLIDEALRQFARTGNLSVSSLRAALRANEDGVSLLKIAPGAAVGVAGAQEGDRVVNVDGEDLTVLDPLEALTALLLRVRYKSPGETIQLTLKRGAATVPATFRLEAPPPPTPPAVEPPAPEPSKSEPPTPSSGLFDP
jgi:S1-C subfamily serine protease